MQSPAISLRATAVSQLSQVQTADLLLTLCRENLPATEIWGAVVSLILVDPCWGEHLKSIIDRTLLCFSSFYL